MCKDLRRERAIENADFDADVRLFSDFFAIGPNSNVSQVTTTQRTMKKDNKTDKATPQIDDMEPRKDTKGGGKQTKGSQTAGSAGDAQPGTKGLAGLDLGSGR